MNVAIIGGGLGGLALGWYLQKAGVAYDVFEAAPAPGGNLRSLLSPAGYRLEAGPNSLQMSTELEALLAELGLSDQVEDAAPVSQHRYVLRGGRYHELPGSPPRLLTSGFFSLGAKWRILRELAQPAAPPDPAETVAQFFRRRFGPEVLDYAVNPFMAGIYAGDPAELLLHKTFPQLVALEQAHGSVLRGLAKAGTGAGRRRIIALRHGNQTLTDTLAARLAHYHPGRAVMGLSRQPDGRYALRFAGEPAPAAAYTHLALALPAYAAAPLLAPLFPAAATALAAVRYPPMSVIFTAYDRAAVAHPLNGFGALNPKAEGTYAAGSVWSSSIFAGRAPAGQVLFTTFVGGTQYAATALDSEETQKAKVHAELSQLHGIVGEPHWQGRYFWAHSIPQFDAHIGPAHDAADALRAVNVVAVANWRTGVGVPDVLRGAQRVAAELAQEAA